MLEIMPIGGFKEIGRNCCAVKVDDEIVILDMGLQMENYIAYTEERDDIAPVSGAKLIEAEAVPNVNILKEDLKKVKAICISHAHLDHVGAVPFLAEKFNCPVHGSPFTIKVLERLIKDDGIKVKNDLVEHKLNATFRISKNIKCEFISVTHSTPHTVIIVLHTKYGSVMYANDFKLDNNPTLGQKPNYERIRKIKPKVLIMDTLYSLSNKKCPSESIAREMLKDVMLGVDSKDHAVVVTTFASHIARLKTIVELAEKMNRKVAFIGRSMSKYAFAAEDCGLVNLSEKYEFVRFGSNIKRFFKKLKNPKNYVLVVTGHQGEPKATLSKMVNGMFEFKPEDIVIFSCNIIPVENNIEAREKLDSELKNLKVRIFNDIHVSGHAAREDMRDLINYADPEFIVPTHGEVEMLEGLRDLAVEIGYDKKNIKIIGNGDVLKL